MFPGLFRVTPTCSLTLRPESCSRYNQQLSMLVRTDPIGLITEKRKVTRSTARNHQDQPQEDA
ncbi:uncharacterized protein Dvar_71110 [Desulfosarcina variabilis str. Montpellier]